MKQAIQEIILDAICELNETLDTPLQAELVNNCNIYSQETDLDSMALVTLIVNIEQKIEDEYGVSVILANEKAMSQRNSPFKNVEALTIHAQQLIEEAEKNHV
jgi:acyl carrier protein